MFSLFLIAFLLIMCFSTLHLITDYLALVFGYIALTFFRGLWIYFFKAF